MEKESQVGDSHIAKRGGAWCVNLGFRSLGAGKTDKAPETSLMDPCKRRRSHPREALGSLLKNIADQATGYWKGRASRSKTLTISGGHYAEKIQSGLVFDLALYI